MEEDIIRQDQNRKRIKKELPGHLKKFEEEGWEIFEKPVFDPEISISSLHFIFGP